MPEDFNLLSHRRSVSPEDCDKVHQNCFKLACCLSRPMNTNRFVRQCFPSHMPTWPLLVMSDLFKCLPALSIRRLSANVLVQTACLQVFGSPDLMAAVPGGPYCSSWSVAESGNANQVCVDSTNLSGNVLQGKKWARREKQPHRLCPCLLSSRALGKKGVEDLSALLAALGGRREKTKVTWNSFSEEPKDVWG